LVREQAAGSTAEHSGAASETAPTSPDEKRATSNTSDGCVSSSRRASSSEPGLQPATMSSSSPAKPSGCVWFGASTGACAQPSSGGAAVAGCTSRLSRARVGPEPDSAAT